MFLKILHETTLKLARGASGQDLLTVCNIVAPAPAW